MSVYGKVFRGRGIEERMTSRNLPTASVLLCVPFEMKPPAPPLFNGRASTSGRK